MAEIVYTYQKLRREFGRHPEFQDSEPEVLIDIHPNQGLLDQFVRQDPYETEIQCVPEVSENSTNTERIRLKPQGMYHVEGGWPAGVDPTEMESKIKYTKKAEREESYIHSCKVFLPVPFFRNHVFPQHSFICLSGSFIGIFHGRCSLDTSVGFIMSIAVFVVCSPSE